MVASQAILVEAPVETTVVRCVVIEHISWDTYERLLADQDDQAGPRLAYDNGNLEIKMLSISHEEPNRTLAQLVEFLAVELDLDLRRLGSTTFLRKDLLKGFEPDSCFYIQNAEAIAGKNKLDLKSDPPPDLIIEVDVTSGSMNKFPIFVAMRIPEVWRYKNGQVMIYRLDGERYVEAERSVALPLLTSELATQFLSESREMKSSAWARRVREWAQEQLQSPPSN